MGSELWEDGREQVETNEEGSRWESWCILGYGVLDRMKLVVEYFETGRSYCRVCLDRRLRMWISVGV